MIWSYCALLASLRNLQGQSLGTPRHKVSLPAVVGEHSGNYTHVFLLYVESRVLIEQVGNKGKVELGVA